MNGPRALIVEDEALLRRELRAQLADLWPELEIAGEAADGIEALRALSAMPVDIVFLDIRVPGLDGLEVARIASGRAHVVFVTAHQEYAVSAFEQDAVDYVLKPLERERLALMVDRVKKRLSMAPPDLASLLDRLRGARAPEPIRWIQASVGNRIRIVAVDEVAFFQSDAKYTKVVSPAGEMHIRRSIKELLDGLDPKTFWQVSRSTIVNVARVEEVKAQEERMEVKMRGHEEPIAVSRPFQHRFRRM